MAALRIRIWAQLQRLSLDYYEREMAGRTMTRMTTDVDQFETLIENGLLQALVSLVTFVGVGVALLLMDVELALWTLTRDRPAGGRDRDLPARHQPPVRRGARVARRRQRRLPGVALGDPRGAGLRARGRAPSSASTGSGGATSTAALQAQRTIATYFPFVLFLSAIADVIVLGVGAHLIEQGRLSTGVLIAFLLYLTMFFSPIQQLSQVFDSWQQTRVSVSRISDLMRLSTLTPEPEHPVALGEVRGELALRRRALRLPAPRGRLLGRRGPADAVLPEADVVRRRPPEALRGLDLHVRPARRSRWSARPAPGSRPCSSCSPASTTPTPASVTLDGHDLRTLSPARLPQPARLRAAGVVPVHRHGPRQHRLRPPVGHRRRGRGSRPRRRRPRLHRLAAPTATTTRSPSAAPRCRRVSGS